ncbi:ATP-binding protein [Halovivax gelatinilyticus]|uniref:ATP-binding protein n=1 Tax=Halovivax gelatinilyticus TaxID=2961597 RepID=UPI0020CA9B5A|nr:ATP-binding protein [Halovivax gelatinilyticus]
MGSPPGESSDLRTEVRQQSVVAELGQRALETDDLDQLMADACAVITEVLDTEYAKVLELTPDGDSVLLRQGVGWQEGLVGSASVPTDRDSQAGYTLLTEAPVIVEDLRTETRFSGPELLTDHDVRAGISVIIGSVEEPWGILGTHSTDRKSFTDRDATFVKNVANVLASAIENVQTERRFDAIFEDPNILVGLLEPDGTVRDINETAMKYVDAELADVVGQPFWETPWWGERDDHADAVKCWTKRAAAGEYVEFDADLTRSNGDTYTLEGFFRPVTDDDGDVVSIIVSDRDVTERTDRERELKRTLDLFEQTEHIADVGGWEIDPETMDVFWTDHIFELLGIDGDEEPPLEDILEMYHEADRERVRSAIETAIDAREPFDTEARIETRTNEIRWLRIQGVTDVEDGEVVTLRGAVQDITAHKLRERRLENLVYQLEQSNERLEQFAYAASHDLQEPLRMVSSYLQLLDRRYADELDEDGEEFIGFAVDGADRMREMIRGLLEYSRVETQGEPLEPVDLETLVAAVRSDLTVCIDRTDASVTVDSLPTVEGDPGQLRQVFQNLFENAIEYSGDEPPTIHVEAERLEPALAAETGTDWIVSVADEGIGIDPDDQAVVFEVFQRLHSRSEHAGSGIGLALCERIIERHGGDIWVDSEPGEGATFYVTLPGIDE